MRIWVSRPQPGAARTASRLSLLGHEALVAPVLRIVPGRQPAPPGPFDGLILTSTNGVEALGDAAAVFRGQPVFAVGARTAERARAAELAPVHCAQGDAGDLSRLVVAQLPPGSVLLHAAGEDRKAEPAASLNEAGYRIVTWTAYAAERIDVLPEPAARALSGADGAPVQAALHYSRRSAETAAALCREAGLAGAFRALAHYCLSSDVEAGLVEAGFGAHFVAARPSEEALLAGLTVPD